MGELTSSDIILLHDFEVSHDAHGPDRIIQVAYGIPKVLIHPPYFNVNSDEKEIEHKPTHPSKIPESGFSGP